jgi:hypothetical protein
VGIRQQTKQAHLGNPAEGDGSGRLCDEPIGRRRMVDVAPSGLAACQVILDNAPNQIAGRGALPSGKDLNLLKDRCRKFHGSLHVPSRNSVQRQHGS